jgi:two-component system response regulator DctR
MLYIVDDEKDVRGALKWFADSREINCMTCCSGEELLEILDVSADYEEHDDEDEDFEEISNLDPKGDCIILDIRMPGFSGIETFDVLAKKRLTKRLPIIFITGHGEIAGAIQALKRGTHDFFEKPFDENALFVQARLAMASSQQEARIYEMKKKFATLTDRETDVLCLILGGKMNKVIGDTLGISMRTVEVHRANILEKMEVKTAMELSSIIL